MKIRVSADEIIWNPKNMVIRQPIGDFFSAQEIKTYRVYPPWHVGDRLWVKETWANINKPHVSPEIIYRADDDPNDPSNDAPREHENDGGKWRPSIFMPRLASRITLEVVRTWLD